MAKLTTLQINNFKFFGNEIAIPAINSQHLLVYGENGSGKSTLYWALYTLLEAAAKTQEEDIQKYFRKGTGEANSLVNIHATQGSNGNYNSFVTATLDNGIKYHISADDTTIKNNEKAKLSNVVTDFINYKILYKAYDFAHSEKNDLFPLFNREVLPYINVGFTPIEIGKTPEGDSITETNALKLLQIVWAGPGNVINARGDSILAQKGSSQYNLYRIKVDNFNTDLQALLTYINTQGNKILKDDFGYQNFEFRLRLTTKADIDKKDKRFHIIKPVILLEIPNYNGISGLIHKPHSFLNEAKLSVLALSIRLAVLERNYDSQAELRLLVLDDLLLSLDMANRDKIIDTLLTRYILKYQIIILTHDFRFFEIAKKRIEHKGLSSYWEFWEMYADEPNGGIPKPIILPSNTYLGKAKKYFGEYDFAAAGNFMRKEAENFVKNFLPEHLQKDKNTATLNLDGLILKSIEFANNISLLAETKLALTALDEHRKFIFNALSHDSYDVSILKSDLQRSFTTLEYLRKIKSSQLLCFGAKLYFELQDNDNNHHRFDIELCGELKLIIESPTMPIPILGKCPFFVSYTKNEVKQNTNWKGNDLKKFYEKMHEKLDMTQNVNFQKAIKCTNEKSIEDLISHSLTH